MTIIETAYKEKNRAPYTVRLGPKHLRVLKQLSYYPNHGQTDAEITFKISLHMAAARRCELRDIGAVRRGGRRNGSWAWKLTERGYDLLRQMERQESSEAVAAGT